MREGVSLEALDAIAAWQTDNEAAAAMQEALDKLFKKFGAGRGPVARLAPSPRHRKATEIK